MESEDVIQMHAFIEGRVQGVGYRYFAQQNAANLGLSGWVRNCWDGRVELIAEGEKKLLDVFYRKLQKGPTSSMVQEIKVQFNTASGDFKGFSVKPNN